MDIISAYQVHKTWIVYMPAYETVMVWYDKIR
jgi:hypothetical protein